MLPRRPSPEHQEAVARRLALLSAELAGVHPRFDDEPEAEPVAVAPVAPVAPVVPVPGRHAARRVRGPFGLLPETLRGRVVLGPAQVTVVAVLVTLGLAVTCWWLVRGDPEQVAGPLMTASGSGLVPAPPVVPGASAAPTGTVTVDVAGRVRHPGIAVLDAGSRVVDALAAAGGARRGVDLAGLNLARVLVDGEQILVGVAEPAGVAASAVPPPGAPAVPLVNLNTATQTELEGLPDVGPVTAQAIIAWRTEHGGFSAVDELLEVDGIGDVTLGKLAPYVTL